MFNSQFSSESAENWELNIDEFPVLGRSPRVKYTTRDDFDLGFALRLDRLGN
jgi:hypothetical protein